MPQRIILKMWLICSKCKKYKALWAFNRRSDATFGVRSHCKECSKKYHKRYYRENINKEKIRRLHHREEHIEYTKQHYNNNKERYNKLTRKWCKDNPDARKKHVKKWKENNKYKVAADSAKRRAIRRKQTPKSANEIKIKFIYHLCEHINRILDLEYHVDHIIPLNQDGLHHQNNLQILTAKENLKKQDKIDYSYRGVNINDVFWSINIMKEIDICLKK